MTAKGPFHDEDLLKLPFLVRWPGGGVPGGTVKDALQALIDLPAAFLSAAGVSVPGAMQGVNQLPVWMGVAPNARDEVLVEFRNQPTTVHLRTYIEARYKLTVYRDRPCSELFDLDRDPHERANRWNDPSYAAVKTDLFQRSVNAELRREPMRFPRIAGA